MEPFIGQIIMFGGTFAPRSWALCYGQLLPISSNSALFSILGTNFGGDGRTTFGLPDLRGRAAVGAGNGPGLSNYTLGAKGGGEYNILNVNQLPAHNHGVAVHVSGSAGEESAPNGNVIASLANGFNEDATSGQNLGGVVQNNVGANQSINNLQPYQVVNYIIALQGTYPSRS